MIDVKATSKVKLMSQLYTSVDGWMPESCPSSPFFPRSIAADMCLLQIRLAFIFHHFRELYTDMTEKEERRIFEYS
jgi:hypothetical protein